MLQLASGEPAGVADGTQTIRRAASILRSIANAGIQGVALADIARLEGLPRSTAHRMLKCLLQEGFIEQLEGSKRYCIGNLTFELSLAVNRSAREVARWRKLVELVAARTGATAYLMRRTGVESVCLLKIDGNSVIRVIPVETGQRRPLGVGAGATALLSALDDPSADAVVDAIAPELKHHTRMGSADIKAALRLARAQGYAVSNSTVADQVFGMGFIIPDSGAVPALAVSIAAHQSLATRENVEDWKRIIREEIRLACAPPRDADADQDRGAA